MGYRLKYIWNKIFWFFAKPIRRVYRFIVRPSGRAVKILITHEGRILLVRPNYAHRLWTVPGGSVERGETYKQAAHREIMEEVGLKVGTLAYLGEYTNVVDYRKDTVKGFVATAEDSNFKVDGIEIKEAAWFSLGNLPQDRVSRVQQILELYQTHLANAGVKSPIY